MAIYKLLIVPHPFLKKKVDPVESVDDEVRQIMDNMVETMNNTDGCGGLAASQLGINKRIVVIDMSVNGYGIEENFEPVDWPFVCANPEIISYSEEKTIMKEGCMSVPEESVPVERPVGIEFEYIDYNNQKVRKKATGILARCMQHEIDHLNGITLLNYLSPLKANMMTKRIEKRVKLM